MKTVEIFVRKTRGSRSKAFIDGKKTTLTKALDAVAGYVPFEINSGDNLDKLTYEVKQ